jgi:hypothetical protein
VPDPAHWPGTVGMEVGFASSNGKPLLADARDLPILERFGWHVQDIGGGRLYASARMGAKRVQLHHLVLGTRPEDASQAYAIDGNMCRVGLANLVWLDRMTICHRAQRVKGKGQGPLTDHRGVKWDARSLRWVASLTVGGHAQNLGSYRTDEEAAWAYDRAARRDYGLWARLNFPSAGDRPPEGTSFPPARSPLVAGDGALLHLDPEDVPLVARHCWVPGPDGYGAKVGAAWVDLATLVLGQTTRKASRIVHVDGDPLNFRKANLSRINLPCLPYQLGNVSRHPGRLVGVRANPSGRFSASQKSCGKAHHLGMFQTVEEAAQAYDRAVLEVYGPGAFQNLPHPD